MFGVFYLLGCRRAGKDVSTVLDCEFKLEGTGVNHIRKATVADASRVAEILVFTKRMNYRSIFHNDQVSFGEMQVLPLAQEYLNRPERLENIWVYDDEFVKGMVHVENGWIQELYVDSFFQNAGIGTRLVRFAIRQFDVQRLYVLEKNGRAIWFYQKEGFSLTLDRQVEQGTTEYVVKMERQKPASPQPQKCSFISQGV